MARFRLRYQATDFELAPGDFVIGRSSECGLAVDDPLVSRKHAVLHVGADAVIVEDLGSRNGISVNGERVKGSQPLRHQDRLLVGSQEMVLIEVQVRERDKRATGLMEPCPYCRLPVASDATQCPHCKRSLGEGAAMGRATVELPPLVATAEEDSSEVTRPVSAFQLLASIADKALALGRPDDAERILANLLGDVLTKLETGRPVGDDSLRDATRYALRLADLTGKQRWVDWVFSAHEAKNKLMGAETIDALYELVRKVRHPGGRAITGYVAAMRKRAGSLGPADRFLLARLEGLERVVGA